MSAMDVDAPPPVPLKAAKAAPSFLPWVEKYRPVTLDDVVGNDEAVGRLKTISHNGNLPNVILAGPPGSGKTSSVLCLARQMLGPAAKEAVLELNASDARGIDIVRNKIKMFAQKKVTLPPGRHKIIILDEADAMTGQAQQALRRTMEIFSSTTRFALACNTSSKIIEPIQSRCAILRYARLSDEQVLARLMQVMELEGVDHDDEGLEALVFTAEGDMRNALNNMQSTVNGFGALTKDTVFKVCDAPHPEKMKRVIAACVAKDINAALKEVAELYEKGYSAQDIIGVLFKVCKTHDMPEGAKLEYIKLIGFSHMAISDGNTSLLQLAGLCAKLCRV